MNETMKRLGDELRRRYAASLKALMNWRMIDTFAKLEEAEEAATRAQPSGGFDRMADKSTPSAAATETSGLPGSLSRQCTLQDGARRWK